MLSMWREKKREKLKVRLGTAIFWGKTEEVKELLRRGADPNALLTDRERSLDLAIQWSNAAVVDALLDAGADPLKPYRWAGKEFSLSEAARLAGREEEIVKRLEQAEQEAEGRHITNPSREHTNSCFSPRTMS